MASFYQQCVLSIESVNLSTIEVGAKLDTRWQGSHFLENQGIVREFNFGGLVGILPDLPNLDQFDFNRGPTSEVIKIH